MYRLSSRVRLQNANYSKLSGTKIFIRHTFSTSCKIEVVKVGQDIVVVVNIIPVRCKIIGGRPRMLFILIAKVLFAQDDEAVRALFYAYRDSSMRYYKLFTVETGFSTNTVEPNITLMLASGNLYTSPLREEANSFDSRI